MSGAYLVQVVEKVGWRGIQIQGARNAKKGQPSAFPVSGGTLDSYFRYLDDLIELARTRGLEFRTLDRLLYVFDKQTNGKL